MLEGQGSLGQEPRPWLLSKGGGPRQGPRAVPKVQLRPAHRPACSWAARSPLCSSALLWSLCSELGAWGGRGGQRGARRLQGLRKVESGAGHLPLGGCSGRSGTGMAAWGARGAAWAHVATLTQGQTPRLHP